MELGAEGEGLVEVGDGVADEWETEWREAVEDWDAPKAVWER